MKYTDEILAKIRDIVESGYYQRLAPPPMEKKSLCERIESIKTQGDLPIIGEVSTALPVRGLLMPSRKYASELIERIANSYELCALDLWVEPREHAGDLRWLAKELRIPLIHNDWIIDSRQIVGGDAIVLDISLINYANADLHELVETAHENDMEAIVQVRNDDDMTEAKKSEADCIMINNYGRNGHADISTSINALEKNGTGRPVISAHGITNAQDVRSLIVAGVSAIEIEATVTCNGSFEKMLGSVRAAVKGKSADEN